MLIGDGAYCCIATPCDSRMSLRFSLARDADFLRAAIVRGRFEVRVEGTIPFLLAVRRGGALDRHLNPS